MSTTIVHGVTAQEQSSGAIPIQATNTAIIGLVAYASDADATFFPVDTPVLVTSISKAISKAGYDGSLRRALETMQLIGNPMMVVVRASGGDKTSVIGGVNESGARTGLMALLNAKSITSVTPKILVAPELENPDVDQAMISVAKKLRGMYYATPRDAQGNALATVELVNTYAASLGDREIELIWPEFTGGNVLGKSQATPA